jgi:DNA primase
MEDHNLIIEILEDILGDSYRHHPGKGQIAFDCPVCSYDLKGLDKGDGKGNLEINYKMGVYKCWACSETNYTKGRIIKLIKTWGSPVQIKNFQLVNPDEFEYSNKKYRDDIKLPYGYTKLIDCSPYDLNGRQVWNYLKKRNIGKDIVEKYQIGFTTEGEYKFRIIVPSYNNKGDLQFFIARSYVNTKLKYKNPEQQKSEIIFNETHLNWEKDIYLVEGVFDMFFLPNSIPLLGKVISDKLWQRLYEECKSNIIICLDGDAWEDSVKLYEKINGGKLRGRVRVVKLPTDKDIADLNGQIKEENILELHK